MVEHKLNGAFILFRQDEPGDHGGVPVAVYVGDDEACRTDMEHRQSVNPRSLYYVLEKPLNPKSVGFPPSLTEEEIRALQVSLRRAEGGNLAGSSPQAEAYRKLSAALAGKEERDG